MYNKISQAYARRPGDDMKSQLEGVKKTLADTRRATQIEFLCFRKEKDKSVSVRPANAAAGSTTTMGSRQSSASSTGTITATSSVDETTSATPRSAREEARERRRRYGPAGAKQPDVPIRSSGNRI